ncbi:MAG: PIN domain-containing protein [Actinobacteria bacterium]|nr:PIN domain-containing protein [Actinomycetota bacterium]
MILNYLDSSALLKVFIQETESTAMVDYFTQNVDRLFTSELTITELIGKLNKLGQQTNLAEAALRGMTLIPMKQEILYSAASLTKPGLRSLDAIHLATARSVRENLGEFVTYDSRLAEAATADGLKVVSPS